jgi:hypothetical protein
MVPRAGPPARAGASCRAPCVPGGSPAHGTGERLKCVGGRSKVAAFDLTFAAPKSPSVLFAIGEPTLAGALVEAHESAVDTALGVSGA